VKKQQLTIAELWTQEWR